MQLQAGTYARDILDSIRRIVRALRVSSRAAERDQGLSGAQLFVLQILRAGAPLSINELAEETHTHQSSVSTVVSKLQDEGLVTRTPSERDARRMEVSITSAGRDRIRSAPRLAQETLIAAIRRLPSAEVRELARLIQKVVVEAGFQEEPASLFFEEDSQKKAPKKDQKRA